MSDDGKAVFVRVRPNQAQGAVDQEFKGPGRLLKNKPAYRRFVREFTSEKPDEYEDGRKVNGQPGLVVPVADLKGMIFGDPNPYGRLVVGHVIGSEEMPQKPLDIAVLEQRVKQRSKHVPNQQEHSPEINGKAVKLPNTSRELELILPDLEGHVLKLAVHKLQKLIAHERAMEEGLTVDDSDFFDNAEYVDEEAELNSKAAEYEKELAVLEREGQEAFEPPPSQPAVEQSIRVQMDGDFGRAIGKFMAVERHADQLVLAYDPEENIFIPASGEKPFNLTFNNRTVQVQNVGIAFGLDFLGVGILVFLIMEA
jgi:hypothetical protein